MSSAAFHLGLRVEENLRDHRRARPRQTGKIPVTHLTPGQLEEIAEPREVSSVIAEWLAFHGTTLPMELPRLESHSGLTMDGFILEDLVWRTIYPRVRQIFEAAQPGTVRHTMQGTPQSPVISRQLRRATQFSFEPGSSPASRMAQLLDLCNETKRKHPATPPQDTKYRGLKKCR
ncbi:hypothetical protein PROFUN_11394 [Planoprotostelium fungivorum]|uniref:Uncharacterized protein n=1 Tax=Planoprotostelium fungivorum TaxID=1890364 RepID=A0A2P6NA75_9EUKA|nr:hypothetical protein PROFUN_11394 [Planoprotostelium fungivorum]